jgi:hypothetical protein
MQNGSVIRRNRKKHSDISQFRWPELNARKHKMESASMTIAQLCSHFEQREIMSHEHLAKLLNQEHLQGRWTSTRKQLHLLNRMHNATSRIACRPRSHYG